jgi:PhzF family phenazine biosynthesis protein
MTEVLRYAAFSDDPAGGNPAGVVLDARGLSEEQMRAIAADVGYSETAFITGGEGDTLSIRYFSPESEVPFCGHATIATGVAHGDRHGPGELHLDTAGGRVDVTIGDGTATLTSVEPHVEDVAAADLDETLAALSWARERDAVPRLQQRAQPVEVVVQVGEARAGGGGQDQVARAREAVARR